MKRLVWLLLVAFGNLLAQVPTVDPRLNPGEVCSCCDRPGACDMPDCVPAPVATPLFESPRPARVTGLTARRAATAPRVVREKFFFQFVPRARPVLVFRDTASAASAASVPRFREHCSLLL